AALFLGGWNDPFGLIGYFHPRLMSAYQADPTTGNGLALLLLNLIGVGIFVIKALAVIFTQMWLRWTLTRPRIDQVLYACVKVLLPFSCVLLLGAAVWQWLIAERPGIPWQDYQPWNYAEWSRAGYTAPLVTQL